MRPAAQGVVAEAGADASSRANRVHGAQRHRIAGPAARPVICERAGGSARGRPTAAVELVLV